MRDEDSRQRMGMRRGGGGVIVKRGTSKKEAE